MSFETPKVGNLDAGAASKKAEPAVFDRKPVDTGNKGKKSKLDSNSLENDLTASAKRKLNRRNSTSELSTLKPQPKNKPNDGTSKIETEKKVETPKESNKNSASPTDGGAATSKTSNVNRKDEESSIVSEQFFFTAAEAQDKPNMVECQVEIGKVGQKFDFYFLGGEKFLDFYGKAFIDANGKLLKDYVYIDPRAQQVIDEFFSKMGIDVNSLNNDNMKKGVSRKFFIKEGIAGYRSSIFDKYIPSSYDQFFFTADEAKNKPNMVKCTINMKKADSGELSFNLTVQDGSNNRSSYSVPFTKERGKSIKITESPNYHIMDLINEFLKKTNVESKLDEKNFDNYEGEFFIRECSSRWLRHSFEPKRSATPGNRNIGPRSPSVVLDTSNTASEQKDSKSRIPIKKGSGSGGGKAQFSKNLNEENPSSTSKASNVKSKDGKSPAVSGQILFTAKEAKNNSNMFKCNIWARKEINGTNLVFYLFSLGDIVPNGDDFDVHLNKNDLCFTVSKDGKVIEGENFPKLQGLVDEFFKKIGETADSVLSKSIAGKEDFCIKVSDLENIRKEAQQLDKKIADQKKIQNKKDEPERKPKNQSNNFSSVGAGEEETLFSVSGSGNKSESKNSQPVDDAEKKAVIPPSKEPKNTENKEVEATKDGKNEKPESKENPAKENSVNSEQEENPVEKGNLNSEDPAAATKVKNPEDSDKSERTEDDLEPKLNVDDEANISGEADEKNLAEENPTESGTKKNVSEGLSNTDNTGVDTNPSFVSDVNESSDEDDDNFENFFSDVNEGEGDGLDLILPEVDEFSDKENDTNEAESLENSEKLENTEYSVKDDISLKDKPERDPNAPEESEKIEASSSAEIPNILPKDEKGDVSSNEILCDYTDGANTQGKIKCKISVGRGMNNETLAIEISGIGEIKLKEDKSISHYPKQNSGQKISPKGRELVKAILKKEEQVITNGLNKKDDSYYIFLNKEFLVDESYIKDFFETKDTNGEGNDSKVGAENPENLSRSESIENNVSSEDKIEGEFKDQATDVEDDTNTSEKSEKIEDPTLVETSSIPPENENPENLDESNPVNDNTEPKNGAGDGNDIPVSTNESGALSSENQNVTGKPNVLPEDAKVVSASDEIVHDLDGNGDDQDKVKCSVSISNWGNNRFKVSIKTEDQGNIDIFVDPDVAFNHDSPNLKIKEVRYASRSNGIPLETIKQTSAAQELVNKIFGKISGTNSLEDVSSLNFGDSSKEEVFAIKKSDIKGVIKAKDATAAEDVSVGQVAEGQASSGKINVKPLTFHELRDEAEKSKNPLLRPHNTVGAKIRNFFFKFFMTIASKVRFKPEKIFKSNKKTADRAKNALEYILNGLSFAKKATDVTSFSIDVKDTPRDGNCMLWSAVASLSDFNLPSPSKSELSEARNLAIPYLRSRVAEKKGKTDTKRAGKLRRHVGVGAESIKPAEMGPVAEALRRDIVIIEDLPNGSSNAWLVTSDGKKPRNLQDEFDKQRFMEALNEGIVIYAAKGHARAVNISGLRYEINNGSDNNPSNETLNEASMPTNENPEVNDPDAENFDEFWKEKLSKNATDQNSASNVDESKINNSYSENFDEFWEEELSKTNATGQDFASNIDENKLDEDFGIIDDNPNNGQIRQGNP